MLTTAGCAVAPRSAESGAGRAWPEAERLFRQDPHWLGADAALSVSLTPERTLWLFGDSFVAVSPGSGRVESTMIRNSVAVQDGLDPRAASMRFAWGTVVDGIPTSFFAESGSRWYWPGHGLRLSGGPLLLFLFTQRATPGEGLGFANDGYAVAVVDQPDAPIASWRPRLYEAPALPFDAVPATAVIESEGYLVALAIRQLGTHAGALVRYRPEALLRGDFSAAQWWAGEDRGWLPTALLGDAGPTFVIDDAGAEASLHWDHRTQAYVHIASVGFGDSDIRLRSAAKLTGPWSAPVVVYRPPESDAARPFVYAAKAHPELSGPKDSDLLVTYVTSSFEFDDLLTRNGERVLYWPRLVIVPMVD